MSVVFHGKISIRSLGVRGVVATSRNSISADRKFSLAATAKEKEISWRSELQAFPTILGRHSNPMSPEPNKSPEPTRGAVTPRAIEGKIEMAMQTEIRHTARGAPAPRVAHL